MAIQPYSKSYVLQFDGSDGTFVNMDPVPAGHLLIVRYVSAEFVVANGTRIAICAIYWNGGDHQFAAQYTGTDANDVYVISAHTTIYLSPSVQYTIGCKRYPIQGGVHGHVNISGELVKN